jgi:hypothetical protein
MDQQEQMRKAQARQGAFQAIGEKLSHAQQGVAKLMRFESAALLDGAIATLKEVVTDLEATRNPQA